MIRFLLAAVTLAALPFGSRAGDAAVRLNIRPMAAPKPALKYQLLPEVRELNPGNPAQWYVRCFQEQRNFFFSKEAVAERARYRALPLAELPADKLHNYGGYALTQADWGARLDALDWSVTQRLQTEGLSLRMPEVGPLRILGWGLQVRFRGEAAGRRYDDAVRTAKTMFGLARHLGEYPAEAANRVGLEIADMALDTLEEMVQQPGCPNLYWALTDLPTPLVDVRKGLQGHGAQVAAELNPLRGDAPMAEAEVEEVFGHLSGGMGFAREQAGLPPRNLRGELKAKVQDAEGVRAARARLVQASVPWTLIWRLPAVQVILLDEKRDYEIRRDEAMKLLGLPPWQIGAAKQGGGCDGLFAAYLPDVLGLRRAQGRLQQRVALLRHVEALRLYAAEHGGKLPATLAEIAVPLPPDPFTGRPFPYRADGATAQLDGSARYEVNIQK